MSDQIEAVGLAAVSVTAVSFEAWRECIQTTIRSY